MALTMNAGQNLASSSLVAMGYRNGLRMLDPARTRMAAMLSGCTSCAITSRRMASIVGCPSTPHGYGLIDTPGHTIVCGSPSLPTMRSASKPSP